MYLYHMLPVHLQHRAFDPPLLFWGGHMGDGGAKNPVAWAQDTADHFQCRPAITGNFVVFAFVFAWCLQDGHVRITIGQTRRTRHRA